MNLRIVFLWTSFAIMSNAWPARAAKVGDLAPAFTAQDSLGKVRSLSDFKGKYVVMEWYNPECPYVKKHYEAGSMQKAQKEWTAKGVVWLTVLSSAPGKEGFSEANTINATLEKAGGVATAVLMDSKGEVGKQFGAKTTPHMFIVNPEGKIIYNGAIDDKPRAANHDTQVKNYVSLALTEALSGKPISNPTTTPYGCGVKY